MPGCFVTVRDRNGRKRKTFDYCDIPVCEVQRPQTRRCNANLNFSGERPDHNGDVGGTCGLSDDLAFNPLRKIRHAAFSRHDEWGVIYDHCTDIYRRRRDSDYEYYSSSSNSSYESLDYPEESAGPKFQRLLLNRPREKIFGGVGKTPTRTLRTHQRYANLF